MCSCKCLVNFIKLLFLVSLPIANSILELCNTDRNGLIISSTGEKVKIPVAPVFCFAKDQYLNRTPSREIVSFPSKEQIFPVSNLRLYLEIYSTRRDSLFVKSKTDNSLQKVLFLVYYVNSLRRPIRVPFLKPLRLGGLQRL